MKNKRILLSLTSLIVCFMFAYASNDNHIASVRDDSQNSQYEVFFKINSSDINLLNANNNRELRELRKIIDNPNVVIDNVVISGYASPDGRISSNEVLAGDRSIQLKEHFLLLFPAIDPSIIQTSSRAIKWNEVARDLRGYKDLPFKEDVLSILNSTVSHEEKEKYIRLLQNGEPFEYLKWNVLHKYRYGDYLIVWHNKEVEASTLQPAANVTDQSLAWTNQETTEINQEFAVANVNQNSTNKEQFSSDKGLKKTVRVIPSSFFKKEEIGIDTINHDDRSNILLKTNALFLGVAVLNAGAEFRLSRKLSLDIPVFYSPYTVSSNYKVRVLGTQPEIRYWPGGTFKKGHFVGVHAHALKYNVSFGNRRYQDTKTPLWGAGISYGYFIPLSKDRFSMELNIGIGYANMQYDIFEKENEPQLLRTEKMHYFGPTRAGVSFSYKLNGNRKRTF